MRVYYTKASRFCQLFIIASLSYLCGKKLLKIRQTFRELILKKYFNNNRGT